MDNLLHMLKRWFHQW